MTPSLSSSTVLPGLNLVFRAPNLLPLGHYLTLALCTKLAPQYNYIYIHRERERVD